MEWALSQGAAGLSQAEAFQITLALAHYGLCHYHQLVPVSLLVATLFGAARRGCAGTDSWDDGKTTPLLALLLLTAGISWCLGPSNTSKPFYNPEVEQKLSGESLH